MSTHNNLSYEMDFITNTDDQQAQKNKFGTLSKNPLAFNPETTGSSILVESMLNGQVAEKSDLTQYRMKQRAEMIRRQEQRMKEKAIKQVSVGVPEVAGGAVPPTEPTLMETIITESAHQPETILERTIDEPDYLPAWFFSTGAQRARAVCKIEVTGIDYKGTKGSWSGTGFLIAPNILLTNNHVLNSKMVAANAVCIFNYETDEAGKVQATDTYSLDPERLFLTSSAIGGLDFTACWIESAASDKYGFVPVFRHAFGIRNNDCANIVQHPDGRHKAVVVQKNEIQSQTDVAVLYKSDTEPGSSGAFVCNNAWKLVALHHASRKIKDADFAKNQKTIYLNEGIKMAAIAAYLEGFSTTDRDFNAARQVLEAFNGVDSAMGYFGSLGRQRNVAVAEANSNLNIDVERVVTSYRGEDKDMDICFWNIEWFNKTFRQKLHDVAWEISVQNLDVWVLSESSAEAAEALVQHLNEYYDLEFDCLASEPNAPSTKQTTTIIWNKKTTKVVKKQWPEKVERWLQLKSNDFADLNELQAELELEAIDGKIFDRYPALFYVENIATSSNSGQQKPFNFHLVPLHLKAMPEGSKRRRFACRILAEAMNTCINEHGYDGEWILGGDLNATIASGDLEELSNGGLVAMSASDEEQHAFSYLKKPHRSMIDHIYLSPNITDRTDKDGFMILARERDTTRDGNPDRGYSNISDHRPIMIRLSLKTETDNKPTDSDEQKAKAAAKDIADRLGDPAKIARTSHTRSASAKKAKDQFTKEDALSILHKSKNKTYYDADADSIASKAYYGKIPSGLSATQLFDHFSKLVTKTHKKALAYKPAVYLYPWVDLQEDLQLVNLYSGESTEPEALITADFEADESEFENQGMYNCEHVVPQSWFNKENPQRGDLHHLFACTPTCNSFRGNIPYTEFPDWEEKVMDNCGNREAQGFEPKRAKGTVARATLYFMLRYPNVKVPYKGASFSNLLAWHLEEPPSLYELHRNAAIQELQGNRNPFIDFPKIATKMDFGR